MAGQKTDPPYKLFDYSYLLRFYVIRLQAEPVEAFIDNKNNGPFDTLRVKSKVSRPG